MNWKQVFYKGLPIFLIAAVIVIVAVIASRPEKQPEVSSPDEKVVDFLGLKATKGSLYDVLKQSGGVSTLIDIIDRDLLGKYEIDEKALEEQIASDKSEGIDNFYQTMVIQGVISSEDDVDAEENIKDYYKLSFLQKAYAKELAINDLENEDIQKAKNDYKKDLCVITLKFESTSEAEGFASELASSTDKLVSFESKWEEQHIDDEPKTEEDVEELPFISEPFVCEYERAVYDEYSSTELRNFIFADTYETEEFKVGDYNKAPKLIGNEAYYFVYKVASPEYIENWETSDVFDNYIKDQLVANVVTNTYITSKVVELHNSVNLKIYDNVIAEGYKSMDTDFKVQKKLLDKNTVATYKVDDEIIKISADDIYSELKTVYATQLFLEKINYEALTLVSGIQLTKAEKEDIIDQIKTFKTNYISQGQSLTWSEYISMYFGAFDEKELNKILSTPQLIERYILGYEEFAGMDPVTDDEMDEAYNKWISITASHLLFQFTEGDAESKALAEKKANQIIKGCTEADVQSSECYIFYDSDDEDDEDDKTITDIPFVGLDETPIKNYETVIAALAKKYSEDPSAEENSGSLGEFGHGDMVPEFEAAAKTIVERGSKYSDLPVESKIEQADGTYIHGFHVIYVKSSKERTEKPAIYDQYKTDEENDVDLEEKYTTEQITEVETYDAFIETIRTNLESKHKIVNNYNKYLADLRIEKEFEFLDPEIQAIYQNITNIHKDYVLDVE